MAKPIMWLLFVASTSIYLVDGTHRRAATDDGPSFDQESNDNKYNVNNEPDMNQENIKEVLLDHGPILVGSVIKPGVNQANEAKNTTISLSSTISPLSSTVISSSTTTASPPSINITPSSTVSSSIGSSKVTSSVKSSSTTHVSSPTEYTTTVKPPSTVPLTTSSKSIKLSSTTTSSIFSVTSSPVSIKSSSITSSFTALTSTTVSSTTVKSSSITPSTTIVASTTVSSPTIKSPSVISSSTSKSVASFLTISPVTPAPTPSTSSQTPSNKNVKSPSKIATGLKKDQPSMEQNINPMDLKAYIESIVGRRKRSPKGASFSQKSNLNKNNTNNSPSMSQENVKTVIDSHPLEKKPLKLAKGNGPKSKVKRQVKVTTIYRRYAKGPTFNQKSNKNEYNVNNSPRMNQANIKTKIHDHHPIVPGRVAGPLGQSKKSKKVVKRSPAKGASFNQKANRNEYNVNNRPKMNQSNVDVKIDDHHPIIPVTRSNSKNLKNKKSKIKVKRDELSCRFFIPPPYRGAWSQFGTMGGAY